MPRHPLLSKKTVSLQAFLAVLGGTFVSLIVLLLLNNAHGQVLSGPSRSNYVDVVNGLPSLPLLRQQMNLLVMGVDSNGKETQRFQGTRSDTIMLACLDPGQKRIGLISIPRDSRVEIKGHGLDKINSAHALGGPELAVQTVEHNFQVKVDHYIVVDTQGLKTLFEAFGPVEVLVEKPMHYQDKTAGLYVDLKPGQQTLDSTQIEEYIRFRHDARGDIGRIERQQWFLRQAAMKLRDPQTIFKIPQLVAFARDNVVTDITAEDMFKLVAFVKDIQPNQVETATLPGEPTMVAGGSYWLPDLPSSHLVMARLAGAPLSQPSAELSDRTNNAFSRQCQQNLTDKPITVAIKYPRGTEETVNQLEALLAKQGYMVRYKWPADLFDCQHEAIVGNSQRADDNQIQILRGKLPQLSAWPAIVSLESHPAADFTLVVTSADSFAVSNRYTD